MGFPGFDVPSQVMDELVGTTEPSLVPRLSREKHVEFKQQSLLMQNNKEFDSEMMITVIFALRTFGRKWWHGGEASGDGGTLSRIT